MPLVLVVSFYFLRQGITIDSLKLGRFQVEGLYLKLDKKLIAQVDRLVIPKSKKKVDFSQIETVLDRIKMLPKYFQYIQLGQVDFIDNHYRVIYRDKIIYLSSDAYEVAGMITRKGKIIEAQIPMLNIKKYGLYFHGQLEYDYRQDNVQIEGNYTVAGLAGNLKVLRNGDRAHFDLNSSTFTSLQALVDTFGIKGKAREWLTRRIAADAYRIRSLRGEVLLDGETFRLDTMTLFAQVEMKNARVVFKDTLKTIRVPSVELTLKNNVLYMLPHQARYDGKSLEGSRLYLTNLLGNKARKLHVKLKVDAPFDAAVAQVLASYRISLPIRQEEGRCRATIVWDTVTHQGLTDLQGEVIPQKGSRFRFKSTPVNIHGGQIRFDRYVVQLKNLDADLQWLRARLNGKLNLKKHRADLWADIRHVRLGKKKNPFFLMKNQNKVPVHWEWGESWKLALPLYKTAITGKKKSFTLLCSDIKPVLPYFTGVGLKFSGGSLRLVSADPKHYRFSGKVQWPSSYLYDKKGPITYFPFSGRYDGKDVYISALHQRITYNGARKILLLNHLYIDGKKALSATTKGKQKTSHLHIKGNNSLIRYDKYVLLTDRFDLRVNGKNTTFIASKDGDTVRVDLNGNSIVVKARRIKAPMLRALIHFGGLTGGRYSLDMQGNIKGTMRGVITIEGGTVSRFKTYNNMIALFNTVPALSTLSDPGFSRKGFEVRSGRIEFRIVKNRIFFDTIYVDGKSAEISGKGTVSTINGAIDMDLAIRTARGLGKLIGSLPIVGYIIMGKDKSITTGVKVTGTLENPKVTTHVVLETLLAPFKMMVRTLKSPAHIINK